MTHVLLVAGLKNPTVRTRYVAARDLLAEYGRLDYCATLLSLLGCDDMTQDQAEMHLDALARAFDDAAAVIRTPFPFASDISELARPIAIDGSRDLIVAGRHREAVFWLVATFSRCMAVFHHDTPAAMHALVSAHAAAYRRLLADVGIASSADLHRRRRSSARRAPRALVGRRRDHGCESGHPSTRQDVGTLMCADLADFGCCTAYCCTTYWGWSPQKKRRKMETAGAAE